MVIQAKRYASDNKVGSPTVRRVSGAADQFNADRAVIATSSTFTGPAMEAARDLEIELLDGDDIAQILNNRPC